MTAAVEVLRTCASREREVGRKLGKDRQVLTDGHLIHNIRALYPEYGQLGRSTCLHRPGVSVPALVFLFPQVVVFVPPMSREAFPARFGISYEAFVRLADPTLGDQRIVFPILNHARYYAGPRTLRELGQLFAWKTPTWDRWHALLQETGGSRWFRLADERFDVKGAVADSELRRALAQHLPQGASKTLVGRHIAQQIRNNFTNLCLVGEEETATRLAGEFRDPRAAAFALFLASEVRAYGTVMGVDGVVNFAASDPKKARKVLHDPGMRRGPLVKVFDARVGNALVRGLGLEAIVREVWNADFLIQYHQSGVATKVRGAYRRLCAMVGSRQVPLADVEASVVDILDGLRDFVFSGRADARLDAAIRKQLRSYAIASAVLSIVFGVLGYQVTGLGLEALIGGTVATLAGLLNPTTRRTVARAALRRMYPDVDLDLARDLRSVVTFQNDYIVNRFGVSRRAADENSTRPGDLRSLWY